MSAEETKTCSQCGAPIDVVATSCKYCGAEASARPQYTPAQQYTPPQYAQTPPPQYAPPQYAQTPPPQYAPPQQVSPTYYSNKSKTTAGILAILLGGIGVHKFYLGKAGQGFLYLIFCWTYIPAIIGFIEGIIYLTTSEENFYNKYVKK